jgi:hypothetical protein
MGAVRESDDDEDALRWAGDEDRGRDAPRLGRSADAGPDAGDAPPEEAPATPGAASRTVATVVFVLPYLALTIGWILGVQRTSSGTTQLATDILWQFGEFLAIVAPVLWFAAAVALTRASRPLVRAGWLALGLGVLVPWPLVLGVLGSLGSAGAAS